MDIRDYLEKNYPGVVQVQEIVAGGEVKGYYAVSANGDELYIPANVSGNQGMVSYIPGSGGSYNDAAMLRSMITDNPPNYVISIAKNCNDYNNCLEVGYNVAQGAGFNITDNVTVCFSASGFSGIGKTEQFLQNHPDVNTTVVSSEPYGYYQIANASLLKENQTPIIFVAPDSGFAGANMLETIKNYKNNGLNAVLMETDYTSNAHIMTNRDVLTNGMLEYLLGYSDGFDTSRAGGYEFIRYNHDTGEFENAQYEDILNPNVSTIRIPDINKLKSLDNFLVQIQDSPTCNKYSAFKNISSVGITSSRTLSSSFSFVSEEMNRIRSKVRNTSFLSGVHNYNFRSGSGIPGCISSYINSYFDIVGNYLNSITVETDSIVSYAQAIVDYDDAMASESEKIGVIRYESETQDYYEHEKQPDLESSVSNPVSDYRNAVGVQGVIPSAFTQVVSTILKSRQPDYTYEFDGFDGLIYMNGGKIQEIKYRYTFDSNQDANQMLELIKKQYQDFDYIKEIVVDQQYVDVIFREDVFENKTKDEFVKDYFKGGMLRG